jgi:phage-related protein
MDTFIWPTSIRTSLAREPRVLENGFGGGYSQAIPDGINTNLQFWPVELPFLAPETMKVIDDWLTAKKGAETFGWTAPHETVLRKWRCKKWKATPDDRHTWTITADFQEVLG